MALKFSKKREQPRRPLIKTEVSRLKPTYFGTDKPHTDDSVRARQITTQKINFWKRLRAIPTLIVLALILLSVAFNTTLTTVPSIMLASQSIYRPTTEYKAGISKILQSSVSNQSKLTINTGATRAAIIKTYPEVDAVTIGLPIVGRRPTVTLHLRKPALVLTTKTNSFVIDDNGRTVAETDKLISSATSGLVTAQDQSGLELHVGDQALTSDTVAFINNVKAQLSAKQLTITNLVLPSGGNEIDVHIKELPYFVKTDSSGDPRIEIGDFLAAKESGIKPAEYIDVRVEEKVFYK